MSGFCENTHFVSIFCEFSHHRMKFVALLSGGKDSCFALGECILQGHELIATANLYPEDVSREEIDSFMYQTVGHNVVRAIAECLQVCFLFSCVWL